MTEQINKKTLIRNNHEATTEEQNEAIRQVEAHSSDAIAKIGEGRNRYHCK
ncbi:DUF1542 domain-containing protein [Staphylococcus epidermidis]